MGSIAKEGMTRSGTDNLSEIVSYLSRAQGNNAFSHTTIAFVSLEDHGGSFQQFIEQMALWEDKEALCWVECSINSVTCWAM
jgi:hypothetical protein